MLDMAGIPEPEQDAGIRAAILRLGEPIVQVAKDSHGIVRHHPSSLLEPPEGSNRADKTEHDRD
jgi:hypothetical protein